MRKALDESRWRETKFAQLAWPEILDEHIGLADKLLDGGCDPWITRVDRDGLLASGLHDESIAHLEQRSIRVGTVCTDDVDRFDLFDPDHPCPEDAQVVGGERAGQDVRPVDDRQPCERRQTVRFIVSRD
jgi:hypothetical protein